MLTRDNRLFFSVGLLLALPASVPTDYVLHDGYTLPPAAFGGVGLIILGFLGYCVAVYRKQHNMTYEDAEQPSLQPDSGANMNDCERRPLLDSSV